MDLHDYWRAVRRRWRSIAACLLLALVVAGVVTWQATPQYASSARLFVSTSPSDTTDAYQGGLFATQRVTSYVDLVQTRDLAERVASTLEEGGDTVDPGDLVDQVSASVVPETVILEITATDPDPIVARDIAQAYGEELTSLVTSLETQDDRTPRLIRISLVDDATVPDSPDSPQPARNLAIALVLGLLAGIGLAVTRDLLDTSIGSAAELASVTGAPLVGSIRHDTASARRDPDEALAESSPWAEAFRVLRTNLQYLRVDSSTKSIVVTSAVPSEGKTTVAADLSVTLALAGQRVVLVECDLRRPTAAGRLDLDDAVGITTVLIGRVGLEDALQPYGTTGLQVLTSGPVPPNPSELLGSRAMADLLDELRSRFDVVVIDAPPLLPVTDAAPLAARADGAVLVVRHGRTTRDQVSGALQRLQAVGAPLLGTVLSMTPSRRDVEGYGYGYGYGYAPRAGVTPPATDASRPEPAPPARAATPTDEAPVPAATSTAAPRPTARKAAPRKTAQKKSASATPRTTRAARTSRTEGATPAPAPVASATAATTREEQRQETAAATRAGVTSGEAPSAPDARPRGTRTPRP